MRVIVIPHLIGAKLQRLDVHADGLFIGEYERSQAADVGRKTAEVQNASTFLLQVHAAYGEFRVRWNSQRREKVITVNGIERGVVPREFWECPSWKR